MNYSVTIKHDDEIICICDSKKPSIKHDVVRLSCALNG